MAIIIIILLHFILYFLFSVLNLIPLVIIFIIFPLIFAVLFNAYPPFIKFILITFQINYYIIHLYFLNTKIRGNFMIILIFIL